MQCSRPQFDSCVGKIPWRKDRLPTPVFKGFSGGSDGKESACNAGDLNSIPGLGKSPGGGRGNPLQVFLRGESPWTEEPSGPCPWSRKEPDVTEQQRTAQHHCCISTHPVVLQLMFYNNPEDFWEYF